MRGKSARECRASCVVTIGLFRVFIFWYHARRFAATIGRDTTMHGIQALTTIPDPHSRRGRHSPLVSLLAIVLLAAMHPPTPPCIRANRTFEQRYVFWHCNAQSALLSAPTHCTGRGGFQTFLPRRSDAAGICIAHIFCPPLNPRTQGGLGGARDAALGARPSGQPAYPSGPRRARRAPGSEPGDVLVCRAHDARRGTGAGAAPPLASRTRSGD
jgi:hypothetical protein